MICTNRTARYSFSKVNFDHCEQRKIRDRGNKRSFASRLIWMRLRLEDREDLFAVVEKLKPDTVLVRRKVATIYVITGVLFYCRSFEQFN